MDSSNIPATPAPSPITQAAPAAAATTTNTATTTAASSTGKRRGKAQQQQHQAPAAALAATTPVAAEPTAPGAAPEAGAGAPAAAAAEATSEVTPPADAEAQPADGAAAQKTLEIDTPAPEVPAGETAASPADTKEAHDDDNDEGEAVPADSTPAAATPAEPVALLTGALARAQTKVAELVAQVSDLAAAVQAQRVQADLAGFVTLAVARATDVQAQLKAAAQRLQTEGSTQLVLHAVTRALEQASSIITVVRGQVAALHDNETTLHITSATLSAAEGVRVSAANATEQVKTVIQSVVSRTRDSAEFQALMGLVDRLLQSLRPTAATSDAVADGAAAAAAAAAEAPEAPLPGDEEEDLPASKIEESSNLKLVADRLLAGVSDTIERLSARIANIQVDVATPESVKKVVQVAETTVTTLRADVARAVEGLRSSSPKELLAGVRSVLLNTQSQVLSLLESASADYDARTEAVRDAARTSLVEITAHLTKAASAIRQRAVTVAATLTDAALRHAVDIDNRLHVVDKVAAAAAAVDTRFGIQQHAAAIDSKFHVTERAAATLEVADSLDARFLGGRGKALASAGINAVSSLSERFNTLRQSTNAAQTQPEAAAPAEAAPTPSKEEVATQ